MVSRDCKIEHNRCRKFEVRCLSFRQSDLVALVFFSFFFNYDTIYLFHRPMVTKPISASRSFEWKDKCTKGCVFKKKNKKIKKFAIQKDGI